MPLTEDRGLLIFCEGALPFFYIDFLKDKSSSATYSLQPPISQAGIFKEIALMGVL